MLSKPISSSDDRPNIISSWSRWWFIILVLCLSTTLSAQEDQWVESCGDVLLYTLPATAVGMTWYHNDQTGLKQWAGAGALTMATTFLLKRTIHAKRPNGEKYSFPSGHSSISFFAAEFVRHRYGIRWGAPMYAAATFVAYSRIHAKKHYLRDVIAGAAIGMAFSYVLTTSHYQKSQPNEQQIVEASILTVPTPLRLHGWNVQVGADGRRWRLCIGGNW